MALPSASASVCRRSALAWTRPEGAPAHEGTGTWLEVIALSCSAPRPARRSTTTSFKESSVMGWFRRVRMASRVGRYCGGTDMSWGTGVARMPLMSI